MKVYSLSKRERLGKSKTLWTAFHVLKLYTFREVAQEDLFHCRAIAYDKEPIVEDFEIIEYELLDSPFYSK